MKRKQNESDQKRALERVIEESHGRMLEYAYAKGFYDGALSHGAIFVPGVGLVSQPKADLVNLLKSFSPTGSPPEPTVES